MEHITPNVDEMLIKMREHLRMTLEESCRGMKMILSDEVKQRIREDTIKLLTMYGEEWYPELAGDDVEYEVDVKQNPQHPDSLTICVRPYRKRYIFELIVGEQEK
jgi:hypothetical protein